MEFAACEIGDSWGTPGGFASSGALPRPECLIGI